MTIASVQGQPIDKLREALVQALVKAAAGGSHEAASKAAKLLDEIEARQQTLVHEQTIAAIAGQPKAMARYAGLLGADPDDAAEFVGQPIEGELVEWYDRGQKERIMEARSIERHHAKVTGQIPDWMNRRFSV